MTGALPDGGFCFLPPAYSVGAHGIMTLNDFKAVEGDSRMSIRSLPVVLGVENAAFIACAMMAIPQIVVVVRLAAWGRPFYSALVGPFLAVQFLLMARLLRDPRKYAPVQCHGYVPVCLGYADSGIRRAAAGGWINMN